HLGHLPGAVLCAPGPPSLTPTTFDTPWGRQMHRRPAGQHHPVPPAGERGGPPAGVQGLRRAQQEHP
ncbi:hypothetical protein ABZV78_22155, partial [Micromonospora sp. NPDC004540]|uniref:hypothetical protein n=1 Tax=Micromonospora sp. NPDC004540 TaxID=3154457 RepID=UPI0033B943AE